MAYVRPKSAYTLSRDEKRELLQEYFDYYHNASINNPGLLNSKIPRSAFNELLDEIGELILNKSESLSLNENEVNTFLKDNPLPQGIKKCLPDDFRVYCLALNAVKQWLSAEQAATDRYVFGSTTREQCKKIGDHCLVSGTPSDECTIELHHPVRDGRPPIPLSKEVHAAIEGQGAVSDMSDPVRKVIYPIKRSGNRSWRMLRLGCELLLDIANTNKSQNVQSSSKTFARKASNESGLNFKELLCWLDKSNL